MVRSLLVPFIGVICFVTVLGQEGNFNCRVFYKPSLIAITSESADMSVILDYSSRLFVVLNGQQNSIDLIDISEQVTYYLRNEKTFNFEDYFQKLSSLQLLLKTGEEDGEMSDLKTLDDSVLQPLTQVFKTLGGSKPLPEISLLTKFIKQLKGPLSLVYMGSGSFRIANGIDGFMKLNQVLVDLLKYSKGNLTPNNIKFNATEIFKVESSVQVLLNVIFQVGASFDLIKVFNGLFTSPEKVQSLLVNASSLSVDGLDGLITIIANYVDVFNNESSIKPLIKSLFNYNSIPGQSLDSFVNQTLTEVANQGEQFNNAPGFSIYVSILEGMNTHNYTSNNISFSDIITHLITRTRNARNPLIAIVETLSSFYPASTVPHFFGAIIKQFNQTLGNESIPDNSKDQVFYKRDLVAIINKPAKIAVISDFTLIVLLNGKRSSIIAVNMEEKVRYYLKNETNIQTSIWPNFEDYFRNLSSLQVFYKTPQDKSEGFKTSPFEEPVRGVLKEIFTSLGGYLPITETFSLLTKFFDEVFRILYQVYLGNGSFKIANGVDAFTKVNLAMAEVLSEVSESGVTVFSEFKMSDTTATSLSFHQ